MIQSMPKVFVSKLKNNYLWSLSKGGKTAVMPRDEPAFTQEMGQYPGIDACVSKSKRCPLTSISCQRYCRDAGLDPKLERSLDWRGHEVGQVCQ